MSKKSPKRTFFEEDTPHGIVKRIMYKKYLQAYIEMTQHDFKTMIIDGFAGAGRYSKEWPAEIEKYGSPLIALMIALGVCHRKEKKQKQNEENDDELGNLQETGAVLQEYKPPTREELKEDDKANNKETLWGWPTSEYDPIHELKYELDMMNRRTSYCKDSAKESKISLIFIESSPKRFKDLAANVELLLTHFLKRFYPSFRYGFLSEENEARLNLRAGLFSISIKILNGKFAEIDPPSALHEKFLRSLTFLDPFGFTQTPMSHIAKFAPGPGNEVLIIFMSSYINRFVSRNTEGVVQAFGMSDYEGVASLYGIDLPDLTADNNLVEFVKYVIHFCEPERKQSFSNNINKVTKNYEDFLKRKTNSKYSLTFEVKGKGNTTIYHMVHITNHIRGVEVMKEAMNRCSQREGEMIMSDYDILTKGHKLNLGNMDDPEKVAEKIFNRFRGEVRVQLDLIQSYLLFETNYLFRKKPLVILQKAGKITHVVDTNGEPQKIEYKFPNKVKNTKVPIKWLISFVDEEYSAENANSVYVKKKQKEKDKIMKKEKRKLEKLQREQSKKEIKKRKEERLEKKRKKEERRRQIDEKKRIRDEEKMKKLRNKEEIEKNKLEKIAKEMRTQPLLTDIYARKNSDQKHSLGKVQELGAGDTNENDSEAFVIVANKTTGTDRNLESDGSRPSSSKKKIGRLLGKENGEKTLNQRHINEIFVSQRGAEADNKSVKGGANQTRKRKSSETKRSSAKKVRSSTCNLDQSTSDNTPNRNSKITEFFQPHNI